MATLFTMRMPRVLIVLAAAAAGLATTAFIGQSESRLPQGLANVLTARLGMNDAQLARLRRGEPVVVLLPASVDREVAAAGAVRIDAPAERTVELVRDIERLESGSSFLQTKRLSSPPQLEDFSTLDVSAEDLKALRRCRPGRCDVKLGQGAFESLARIDWNAPDAPARVTALARQTAFDYVQAYRQGGNRELAVYRDRDRPLFIAEEFADMVRRTSLLPEALPDLVDDLLNYPRTPRVPGAEDFFYWSVADFGLKPVFRLNHVIIHRGPPSTGTRYAIATKQLYASHYFHTGLEVRALVADDVQPENAHYLVVLNIARSDGLTGLFGGLVKSKVREGSRTGLEKALRATKQRVELGTHLR